MAIPDCATCGACCREGFDAAPAEGGSLPEELTYAWSEEFTIVRRLEQGRGTRCICLIGDGCNHAFRCTQYAQRPTACRELEAGSENCMLARRRVGLEPATIAG